MPNDKITTDEEIVQAATEEWMRILARLWEAIDKPIEANRLEIYSRELGGVPLGLLEKAVSRCIRENTWNTVPSIGKVWEALRKELGDPWNIDQAIENWKDVQWHKLVSAWMGGNGTE